MYLSSERKIYSKNRNEIKYVRYYMRCDDAKKRFKKRAYFETFYKITKI